MKTHVNVLLAVLFVFLLAGCKNEANQDSSTTSTNVEAKEEPRTGQAFVKDDEARPTVLHIAIGSADHSTLVAAVQAAELENALVNAGPLMVFAPTNAAFDALPEGTVENLLLPENKEKLAKLEAEAKMTAKAIEDFRSLL